VTVGIGLSETLLQATKKAGLQNRLNAIRLHLKSIGLYLQQRCISAPIMNDAAQEFSIGQAGCKQKTFDL
jgi:hypothetical protein